MRKSLLGIIGIALLAFVAPAGAKDQTITKTVPFVRGGALRIENVNGSVEIRGWDRDEIEIRAVKSALRSEDLDLVQVEIKPTADRVEIETRYPADQGVNVSVEYVIHVPRRVVIESAATVNGAVRVSGVKGSGELRSVNGDVEVSEAGGGFNARTTNGSIREELESYSSKPLDLETMNGSVFVALPSNAGAEIDALSMNGDIRTQKPVLLKGAYTRGSFRGMLGPGGAPLKIRTVNGAIQIAVYSATV
jgi:DUF4097 and DUF4098 domain-containing protein YvlB